jgi:PKD repeat protein
MKKRLLAVAVVMALPSFAWAQNQPPVANAGVDRSVYTGAAVNLVGSATDPENDPIEWWWWSVTSAPSGANYLLTDGFSQNAVFQAFTPGRYLAALMVGDAYGASAQDVIVLTVGENRPPVAVAEADVTYGLDPLTVHFDASGSHDPEAGPLEIYWSFGDGTETWNEVTPTHVYRLPGQYVVYLAVTDERGLWSQDKLVITVASNPNLPPEASPVATPMSGTAPLTVQFSANASDPEGDPLRYTWNFGDGLGMSTLASVTYVYTQPGIYGAWLAVSDGRQAITYSFTIVVSPTIQMSVASAVVKVMKKDVGSVDLVAHFDATLDSGDDLVAITLDGIELFALPFSAFRRMAGPGAQQYRYEDRDSVVTLDLEASEISVHSTKVVLIGFDPANGVAVELMVGPGVAVENIPLVWTGGDRLVYSRR